MPYQQHDLFTNPKGDNLKLWRYMDFTKLLSMISTNSLFFPSAKMLKQIDPWEGTFLRKQLQGVLRWIYEVEKRKGREPTFEYMEQQAKSFKNADECEIDVNFISCWHCNSIESAAMWRLYLKGNEGIAIQTTFDSFSNCFEKYDGPVYIGQVRYKDYAEDIYYDDYDPGLIKFYSHNGFLPFIHKRKYYEHEREYRAIAWLADKGKTYNHKSTESGIFIPINLDILIVKVLIAPGAPEWFKDLVSKAFVKYGINKNVERSAVDDKPFDYDLEPYKVYS